MMERPRPALVIALVLLSLLALAPSSAPAQAAPPALGSGATCYWGGVWPPSYRDANGISRYPAFPDGYAIKACVSTDPTAAAECWFGVTYTANTTTVGGMTCTAYNNGAGHPYLCGTGGYVAPDFKCGVLPPEQCTYEIPGILDASDENCTTPCSTGYRDGNGNCTTPPAKPKKKEPFSGDCETCNASAGNDTENPTGPSKTQTGMSVASIFAMHVSQNISDIPVGYQPPKGPGAFIRLSYNQKDEGQPASFGYYNVGPKWTLNTLSFVTDDPATPGANLMRYVPTGGHVDYKNVPLPYNGTTGAFPTERSSQGTLYRIPATGAATSYELRFASGTTHVYGLSDGATVAPRRMFLTKIIDPQGNAVTLNYDASLRLTSLTDATGRATTFGYTNADPKKVTRITDPFGRHADLSYDGAGRLATITDTLGIVSSFAYSTAYGGYINALTTPYGTTGFNYYETAPTSYLPDGLTYQAMEQTDPLGNTKRVMFRDHSSLAATPAPTPTGMTVAGDYSINNSFIWDEHAYPLAIVKDAGGNVTAEDTAKAHLMHWLKNSLGAVASVRAAVKAPLENPVFFDYPGQASAAATGTFATPTAVGRVLDNATSQVTRLTYNPLGKPLTVKDPTGYRVTTYTYAANNIDVLTVKQGANLIATFANYTAQHKPQSYTDAAGKLWNYAYNAAGQTIYATDPLNATRFWEYDSLGRVTRTTVPTTVAFASVVYGTTNTSVPTATSYTYDAFDRVRTKTDAAGYVLTYDYDALDHVTRITYPDASHDDYDYTFQIGPHAGQPSLDVWKFTDRLGRITTYTYDANRRLTSVTEPVTSLPATTRTTSYSYYENGALKDQTDANGNVTHYAIDIQGRPVSKTYAYGTANAKTETTAYETTTSRIKATTDALAQVKTITYGVDDLPTAIAYTNAVNPTPNVSVAWDYYFRRPTSMTDGTGTTSFTYIAPGTNGALRLATIDNAGYANDTITNSYDALGRLSARTIAGGNEAFTYDTLGRMQTHATGLGTFTYGYLGQTSQVTSRSLNGTSLSTAWAYDTNSADRRLTTITNSGATRSYGLSYIIPGGGGASSPYDIQGVTDTAAATHPWTSQTHGYSYDQADRLLTASQPIPGNNAYAYDKLDNATTVTNPGSGTVNPTYNAFNQLATFGPKTYAYDANGNTLSGDGTKTYKWDAENRLVEIDYVGTSNKTVFTYDAFGHRILTAETVGGTTTTARNLWCGDKVCQTRTSADVVTRRHYAEGEHNIATGQKLVYMQDQLGSVRDVLDATTGALVASYDYGPYGGITRSWGTANTDYRYAGLFFHPNSGLNLATYRGYDGATGRFLNRDPVRERGGISLYAYTNGSPIFRTDFLGLSDDQQCFPQTLACPSKPPVNNPEWRPYWGKGGSTLFHCGGSGYLEDRPASPEFRVNECFYDSAGDIIKGACAGTPDEYDEGNYWHHVVADSGGLFDLRDPAHPHNNVVAPVLGSIKHFFNQLFDWDKKT